MDDEKWMQEAIKAAIASGEKYGHSVGSVIVREDGRMVMSAMSINNNMHAELGCIQALLRQTGRRTIDGCVLYSTQEPCSMCFGAVLYANMQRVVFGAYAGDMPPGNDYESKDYSVEKLAKQYVRFDGGKVFVLGGVLREECQSLTNDHVYWTKIGSLKEKVQ